nr:cytochrome B561 and DOMON domain-containing protein At5g47530-like [Ipomoea batatas]
MDTKNVLFSFVVCCSLVLSSSAQTCRNYNSFASNKVFTSCTDLPFLKSFLHWTYDPASMTARIAYRHTGVSPSRWVAWGINPTSHGMVGTQALIAYQESADGRMKVYTAPIDSYQTGLQAGDLSFPVSDLSATYSDKEITIFATLKLQNLSSSATLNQVWQEGPVSGGYPGMHDTSGSNVQSMGTLNLLSGQSGGATVGSGTGSSQLRKKNIHGLLNTASWGIMMPIGALFARYLKVFKAADPAWFYLHATCQILAYIVGVSGWATGLQLGSQSPGVQFTAHRTIGIVLFCLATIQVSAMLVRPKKEHKHRVYWNMYHHAVGYYIIILGIINIFKGVKILNPEKKWESGYVGILVGLGLVAATLEVFTWCVVIKRKKNVDDKIPNVYSNVYNNGYESRQHTRV